MDHLSRGTNCGYWTLVVLGTGYLLLKCPLPNQTRDAIQTSRRELRRFFFRRISEMEAEHTVVDGEIARRQLAIDTRRGDFGANIYIALLTSAFLACLYGMIAH